jgi:hypothetical protein
LVNASVYQTNSEKQRPSPKNTIEVASLISKKSVYEPSRCCVRGPWALYRQTGSETQATAHEIGVPVAALTGLAAATR